MSPTRFDRRAGTGARRHYPIASVRSRIRSIGAASFSLASDQGGDVDLLDEVAKREATQRADLESTSPNCFITSEHIAATRCEGYCVRRDHCLREGMQLVDVTKQRG